MRRLVLPLSRLSTPSDTIQTSAASTCTIKSARTIRPYNNPIPTCTYSTLDSALSITSRPLYSRWLVDKIATGYIHCCARRTSCFCRCCLRRCFSSHLFRHDSFVMGFRQITYFSRFFMCAASLLFLPFHSHHSLTPSNADSSPAISAQRQLRPKANIQHFFSAQVLDCFCYGVFLSLIHLFSFFVF